MGLPAKDPNDLEAFFVERANAGDVDGLVALYEPSAMLISGDGEIARGHAQLRDFFARFLSDHPRLEPSDQAPARVRGEFAVTTSRHSDGSVSAEIARRQADGSWLWLIDQFVVGYDDE